MAVGIFLDSQLSNSRVQYAASFPNMMIFMVTFPFTWYNPIFDSSEKIKSL